MKIDLSQKIVLKSFSRDIPNGSYVRKPFPTPIWRCAVNSMQEYTKLKLMRKLSLEENIENKQQTHLRDAVLQFLAQYLTFKVQTVTFDLLMVSRNIDIFLKLRRFIF